MGPRRAGLGHPLRREGARHAQTRVREEGGRRASLWLNPLYSESGHKDWARRRRAAARKGGRRGSGEDSQVTLSRGSSRVGPSGAEEAREGSRGGASSH